MAMWKHYIVLFGGFYDPGIKSGHNLFLFRWNLSIDGSLSTVANYLNDLWLFDTTTYTWRKHEFAPNASQPSPRSGFSFLPTADGILLHGGYVKTYTKGKRPVGTALDDTWFLKSVPPYLFLRAFLTS